MKWQPEILGALAALALTVAGPTIAQTADSHQDAARPMAPAGLQRLLEHLRQSHELDGAGQPVTLGLGLYGHSRFYASREQFHLFKTCNVWVATALQAAGVQVTPALTLTSERLMVQLRPLAKVGP